MPYEKNFWGQTPLLQWKMGGCCSSCRNQVGPRKEPRIMEQKHIEAVRSSWAVIAENKEKFGVFVYNHFLTMEKELREYFPTVVEEDGKETFRVNEVGLRRHALKVLDGIGLAVECLGDTERLQRVLRGLGVRHFRAGIKPEMLQKLYPAVHEGMRMLLGTDYSKQIRIAWQKNFRYMIDSMTIAMAEEEYARNQS